MQCCMAPGLRAVSCRLLAAAHSRSLPRLTRSKLADCGLGQVRATMVDGGAGALLEIADQEAVPVRRRPFWGRHSVAGL